MKVCVLQPPYSRDTAFCDEYFAWKLARLDECDDSLDMIVLPEYSDVPCVTKDMEETLFYHNKYMDALMEKCMATARRCHALVFVNALDNEHGWRNTTFAFGRNGELLGKYYKKHLPPLELETANTTKNTCRPWNWRPWGWTAAIPLPRPSLTFWRLRACGMPSSLATTSIFTRVFPPLPGRMWTSSSAAPCSAATPTRLRK